MNWIDRGIIQHGVGFEDPAVLGSLPVDQAAVKLRNLGAKEDAAMLEAIVDTDPTRGGSGQESPPRKRWPFQNRAWQHTAHAFGYLAPEEQPGRDLLPICQASNIRSDDTLKRSRITISLDRLRIASYPGGPNHHLLFSFSGQNHLAGSIEYLHFNAAYEIQEDGDARVLGYPIFVGLYVGNEGVSLGCRAIKVKNKEDESLLSLLESDIYRGGLRLASTSQPAIPLFSNLASSLTRIIAARNALIQEFYLGLNFGRHVMGARLAEGSYIAVQIPESRWQSWDWEQWVYDPLTGRVVGMFDGELKGPIPFNYIVFSVRRYDGE